MREKFLKILNESYYNLTDKDKKNFEEIMQDDGLGKCKPKFNLWGFLFGWFYLLYRRMSIEAIAVLLISLLFGYILVYLKFHPLLVLGEIFIINSFLSGFCYYFLYLNKFSRDIDYCGEYNTDIDCMKKRAKPKLLPVVIAVIFIVVLIWPWIYALITGVSLRS
ncbi:DUF2628 domain-containing protein [Caminibacter mediatlanticus]|uniref:Dihydroorotase n=1 Tax=Caminibacter mediatlanticus TB-2 TaxID=391592 RepID=A0AAI9F337_9BACT|nr:DUF2628 domain-containing protein [Caminibacter mediatlanticus]EDM24231.1 dihydroorotase [Caminibacter mediatlanticus TB-2]